MGSLLRNQPLPCLQETVSSRPLKVFSSLPRFIPAHHPSADLIRHGKHYNHHHGLRHDMDDTPPTAPPPPPPPAYSPPAREAAEIIVHEEREERSQMPTYKGLEQYKLTDKMGESVILFFLLAPGAHLHPSGAFSNVYRAVETANGRNVAGQFPVPFLYNPCRLSIFPPPVKVVRKFELNASQVSSSI